MSRRKTQPKRVIVECPEIAAQLQALRHNTVAIESALIDWNNHAAEIAIALRRIASDSSYSQSRLVDCINALRFELMAELRSRQRGNFFSRWLIQIRLWWQERAWRRHAKQVAEKSVDLKEQADQIVDRNPSGRWG